MFSIGTLAATAALLLQQATVFGWVRAEGSLEPVAFASVEVVGGRTVMTNEHGYYVIPGIAPGTAGGAGGAGAVGRVQLRAGMLGYGTADTTVVVGPGESRRVDFLLTPRPVQLEAIEVAGTADELGPVALPGPPPVRIDVGTLNTVPALAEKDAFRAIQILPSVAAASDFSSALYIRGGSPDQNLILVDGAPLFNPYHLGGLFSAIDPDAIATMEILPGAMPAADGDRASGVVKIWTRDGGRDRLRGHGAIGLVSSRLGVDGPLPGRRGSYLVSGRRTYFDLMTKAAYELGMISTPFPYSFTDAHAKITHDVGLMGRLNVSGYINDERVRTPREVAPFERTAWTWGTRAGSVAYAQPLSAAVTARIDVAATSFDGAFDVIELSRTTSAADTLFLGRITMRDVVLGGGLTWYGARHEARAGLQVDLYDFRYHFRIEDTIVTGDPVDDDIAGRDLFSALASQADIATVAGYVETEWAPTRRLSLRAGLRALHADGLGTELMPRVGLRYALTDRFALTAGAGRYAQAIQSIRDEESILASVMPYELLVPASPGVGMLVAEDVVAGLEYRTRQTHGRLEAYAKRYPNLPTPPLAADPMNAPVFVREFRRGTGSAAGLEALLQHRLGDATLTGSYALTWATRELDDERYTPRFHRRHLLDLSGGYDVGRGTLTARLATGTGQPFTPAIARVNPLVWNAETGTYEPFRGTMMVLGEHNSERLPGYLRMDLGARTEIERRWFGRDVTITPYLQVLNVLGTRNVVTGRPVHDEEGPVIEYFPALPTLPTFGVEWRF